MRRRSKTQTTRAKKGKEPSSALNARGILGPSEHEIQCAFFDWVDIKAKQDPIYKGFFAIPNGGHRHIGVARKMKREGARPGVPDVMLPFACACKAGLAIEFKKPGGKLSPVQKEWKERLDLWGWHYVVCFSVEEAMAACEEYLRGIDFVGW
jgi:hypothetical protein